MTPPKVTRYELVTLALAVGYLLVVLVLRWAP